LDGGVGPELAVAGLCVTVIVRPPTLIAAVRSDGAGFAAAVKVTVPLPDPDEFVVSHEAVLDAVHAQLAPAVMFTDPLPPAAGTDADALLIV
jgi:hypothetical protein